MLSAAPFIAELPQDLAWRNTSLFTVHGRYGNNALNGDWELGITSNTSAPPQQQSQRTWKSGTPEPFTFAITKIPASLTAPAATSGDFTIGGSNVKASYTDIASYEPNAIKIWARSTTTGSGVTIKDLKIKTPGVPGETVFPGTVINVSQDLGPVFQEIIIAGIDFPAVSGGTVTLEGNVTMQFGTDPALRGSALQFHVIATHIPWVDLDVDSNNIGGIDDRNGRSGTDDPIEDRTDLPGVIVPVGGTRAKMVVHVAAGRTATLAFAQGVDMVRVYAQETGGNPVLEQGNETTTIGGGPPQTFWIEAFAPSASLADIAFTLTPTGGSPASADTIRATAVAVDLGDVNQAPKFGAASYGSASTPLTFEFIDKKGKEVCNTMATDPDYGQTLTYSIQSGNSGGLFAIDASTGKITLAKDAKSRFADSYTLMVKVTDSGTPALSSLAQVFLTLAPVKLDKLTLTQASDTVNAVSIPNTPGATTLYVLQNAAGVANVNATLAWTPNKSAYHHDMRWNIDGTDSGNWSATAGIFSDVGAATFAWAAPATGTPNRSFTMTAWADTNGNGKLDTNEDSKALGLVVGKAVFTVYAAQPVPKTRNVVDLGWFGLGEGGVGHSFWGTEVSTEVLPKMDAALRPYANHKWGYYPNFDLDLSAPSGPGALHSDDGHRWIAQSKPYVIEKFSVLQSILRFTKDTDDTPGTYDLRSNNCTTMAIAAGESGGLSIPKTFRDIVLTHWVGGSFHFRGYNPGDLGEDLIANGGTRGTGTGGGTSGK